MAFSPGSRPRTALLIEETSEVLDLSGRGLSDTASLERCRALVSLSLCNNDHLSSVAGLQRCARLWTLDLRGCALTTIEPLLQLGALGELQLAHNRLTIGAALKLKQMALGLKSMQPSSQQGSL